MKKLAGVLFFLIWSGHLSASVVDSSFTVPVLNFDLFIQLVFKHHPYSKTADLQVEKGENMEMKAKGGFDPYLFSEGGQKYFDGDQYYSLLSGGVTIPTWFGVEVNAGYSSSDGYYLNPQNRLPETGLFYAGVSVPLGKDLFIDKRRAELKKAKLYNSITLYEQISRKNELLLDAGIAYWKWFWAYHELSVVRSAYDIGVERFNAVKSTAEAGDRPFVDTLEALIQVQNRSLQLSQSQVNFSQALNELNVYLWVDGVIPVELDSITVPPKFANMVLPEPLWMNENSIDSLIDMHPDIGAYNLKLKIIDVQEQYYLEQLKPKIDLKYNAISEAVNGNPLAQYNVENYTWGFEISFPVFLREQRADLKLNQIEELETGYELNLKRTQLKQKVLFYQYEIKASREQFQEYLKVVENYRQLLVAENELFQMGESSLFMVNARENSYVQTQLKLLDIIYKNQKAFLMLHFMTGDLCEQIQLNGK